ncbi:tyrosine-type recombinase/integrase [Engelhardtia mirabilis]|uniref:Tyrosine recombinase XerD n=1 Tax=Engelhardtia mirabilis TaxID=2528011 RepID=A0A518BH16_9BACT|nr:Tyrosine recombinase XerD [Planctomycetes bacterium Pla133]QDV00571.1 Tyrosine recombinase XerD [Planctomycetes bacterium Pla86]
MDFATAVTRHRAQLLANGRSQHTLEQYHRHLQALARWLAACARDTGDVADIDHLALADFLASPEALLRPDGRAKKTTSVNALRNSLRGFFRYLHSSGVLADDPGRLLARARAGEGPPEALVDADQERLLQALAAEQSPAGLRDHALFRLLLSTGVRLGSALALEVGDLDLDRGEALLRRCKGGQIQRVFLPEATVGALQQHLGPRAAGAVFPGQAGAPMTARHAQRRLDHWLDKAGCHPSSPHRLRHAFALGLYARTRDVLLVQRALGHRSIESTLRYARATDDELRLAIRGR